MKKHEDKLHWFFTCYLNEDWPESYGTWQNAISDFLNENNQETVLGVLAALEWLVAQHLNEDDLHERLIGFGSAYYPLNKYGSFTEWLVNAHNIIADSNGQPRLIYSNSQSPYEHEAPSRQPIEVPNLKYFLSSYFHQDWSTEFDHPEKVVADFLNRESRTVVVSTLNDLKILLSSKLDEDQLAEFVNNDLECYYYPLASGRTYRQWLLLVFYQINLHLKTEPTPSSPPKTTNGNINSANVNDDTSLAKTEISARPHSSTVLLFSAFIGFVLVCLLGVIIFTFLFHIRESQANTNDLKSSDIRVTPTSAHKPTASDSMSKESESRVAFSIKQISDDSYEAVIPAGKWVDTRVPVIPGYRVYVKNVKRFGGKRFILKVGGNEYPCWQIVLDGTLAAAVYTEEGPARFSPSLKVPFNFQDTAKIKVDDEGTHDASKVFIYLTKEAACPFWYDPAHMALHAPSDAWFDRMKKKLARRSPNK